MRDRPPYIPPGVRAAVRKALDPYSKDPVARALASWIDDTFPEAFMPDWERRARAYDARAQLVHGDGDDETAGMLWDAARRLREDKR